MESDRGVRRGISYGEALRSAFDYLLTNYEEVFVVGQGLWSPWYVGNSMTDLDKKFGVERVIDTPVSESACTGAAVGASLCGMRPIVVHPRMDFMLYAMDPIVNQAAKWSHMMGGQANPAVTIRSIINRGGEQGAQHSQALHSWFAHIPGLRVVMPYSVSDARDLLIASVLCDDPVVFIDDRWLYDTESELGPARELDLRIQHPEVVAAGNEITVVGVGYGTHLAILAREALGERCHLVEVVDSRVLNPFDVSVISESLKKTGRLLVVDVGTITAGFSAEIIASAIGSVPLAKLKSTPRRLALPDAPAPTSRVLEAQYYLTVEQVIEAIDQMLA